MDEVQSQAEESYCYLTTIGRRTGQAHTVEIWFALSPTKPTLYILSGGRDKSDWVQNLLHDPNIEVRIGDRTYEGSGRIVEDPEEERLARRLVVKKYYGRDEVKSTGWEAESLPVAIDLKP